MISVRQLVGPSFARFAGFARFARFAGFASFARFAGFAGFARFALPPPGYI